MSEFIFKLPDLGEGTVEAEIILWHVVPGDVVREGQLMVDVMTDKANIEVPAPASGRVIRTRGNPGDLVAVGTELVAIETGVHVSTPAPPVEAAPVLPATVIPEAVVATASPPAQSPGITPAPSTASDPAAAARTRPGDGRVLASPALRKLAGELGLDLATIPGSGPRGRILRRDLDAIAAGSTAPAGTAAPGQPTAAGGTTDIKVIGVRRVIAERMQAAKREIPHFAYVEELDMTALESLRTRLNERATGVKLTFLPFIAMGLIRALRDFPQCNAHFDAQNGVIRRFSAVHLGIATQTPDGLKVPVVHDADRLDLHTLAQAIQAVAEKARNGTATRQELAGSTITLTSLGKLGGIVSTPVINAPEMGIIGINKAVQRPMVVDGRIEVRLMMNLSSSFDHRFVDGFDAASMIQAMKALLEEPALLFMP